MCNKCHEKESIKKQSIPESGSQNITNDKNIMDMIYSNPNIFKIIPEKLLTEEICVLYARISSTAIADMPSKFYTDDVITNYIHYWGYLNQLSFVKDINVDEMIAKTIIKFSSRTNIDLASITTGVLDYLIEHEEDSLYLTYSGSYNLFRKDNNLMKLHDKYGVSFLKNIRMNISVI